MDRFTALDLQRRIAPVQEAAIKSPVAITHHGRDRLVLMSIEEFEKLKRRERQVIAMTELPDEFIAALQEPYRNPEQEALDGLLDD